MILEIQDIAYFQQLLHQHARQIFLLLGTGLGQTIGITLGIDLYVFAKTGFNGFHGFYLMMDDG